MQRFNNIPPLSLNQIEEIVSDADLSQRKFDNAQPQAKLEVVAEQTELSDFDETDSLMIEEEIFVEDSEEEEVKQCQDNGDNYSDDFESESEEEEEDVLIKKCNIKKNCGHRCTGAKGEKVCLPCLHSECHNGTILNNSSELCAICYTSELGEEACVRLECGHVFHANCVHELLGHRWNTLKVSFAFMSCPSCKQDIEEYRCKEIEAKLSELRAYKKKI